MTTNNIFSVRVLKAEADTFVVTQKDYALPEGGIVADASAFKKALVPAYEYMYSTELAEAVKKAAEALRKREQQLDDCKCNVEDVEAAEEKLRIAKERYAIYPTVPVCDDDFALFVVGVITASQLVNIDKASKMINHLRMEESYDAAACKRDIVAYINDCFNLRTEARDYVKPYDCASGLNLKKVENLRKVAQAETLKWTSTGIEGRRTNDRKVWQQVMLTILRDAFRLEVYKEAKAGKLYLV